MQEATQRVLDTIAAARAGGVADLMLSIPETTWRDGRPSPILLESILKMREEELGIARVTVWQRQVGAAIHIHVIFRS